MLNELAIYMQEICNIRGPFFILFIIYYFYLVSVENTSHKLQWL